MAFRGLSNHGDARMDRTQDRAIEAMMEHLIAHGPENIGTLFGRLFELAMRIERERHLGAKLYERAPERRGYTGAH